MPQCHFPENVVLREVGLRDGLQNISRILPLDEKKSWIFESWAAGIREIEVGSFVPPRLLPQLADTEDLVAYAKTLPGLSVSVLVPNLKGALAAMDANADWMLLPLSASNAHSMANLRKTAAQVLEDIAAIVDARGQYQSETRVEVGISTAFGCTIQGDVAPEAVLEHVKALAALGVDRISLADTVGYADPRDVFELFTRAKELAGGRLAGAHFHDTRGLGIANVMAAMQAGQTRFDASLAGIGGCPHAPGASGNVATEDLVYLFTSMGVGTNIDVQKILALRAKLAHWLDGEYLAGTISRAGLPFTKEFKSS